MQDHTMAFHTLNEYASYSSSDTIHCMHFLTVYILNIAISAVCSSIYSDVFLAHSYLTLLYTYPQYTETYMYHAVYCSAVANMSNNSQREDFSLGNKSKKKVSLCVFYSTDNTENSTVWRY